MSRYSMRFANKIRPLAAITLAASLVTACRTAGPKTETIMFQIQPDVGVSGDYPFKGWAFLDDKVKSGIIEGIVAESKIDRIILKHKHKLKYNPNDSNIFFAIGTAYLQKWINGRQNKAYLEDSIKFLTKAIKEESDNPNYYAMRGMANHRLNRNKKAFDDISRAINLDPRNSTFRTVRVDIYYSLGRMDEAKKEYLEVQKLKQTK